MPPWVFAIARFEGRGVVEEYEDGLKLQEMSTMACDVGEGARGRRRDLNIHETDLIS